MQSRAYRPRKITQNQPTESDFSHHPAACGRHVFCGIRQSLPSNKYESCAAEIVTTPSAAEGHKK
jgi:hypothetical protein